MVLWPFRVYRTVRQGEKMSVYDAVIISGGTIDDVFVKHILEREKRQGGVPACLVIAADRGLLFFLRNDMTPDIAIGDFDSTPDKKVEEAYSRMKTDTEFIRLKPEKDVSDTHAAMLLAAERGAKRVLLLGGTGTRLDHVTANLGLLLAAEEAGASVVIQDPHNCIFLAERCMTLKKSDYEGRYVSLFPLGGNVTSLTLTGFKYPLTDYTLRFSDASLTVSNEIIGEEAEIAFKSGCLAVMITED